MSDPFAPGPQAGGRGPAPGRLGLVQAFVNSHFSLEAERGADLLASPAGLAAWLEARGLAPGRVTDAERQRALTLREGLRAQLAAHAGARPAPDPAAALAEAARGLSVGYAVGPEGATAPVVDGPGVAGALGLVLAVVHEAQVAGTWPRLKACPGDHCGWAFYDASRNAAGTWCSMRVCGGRAKARAHRRRAGGAAVTGR